MRGINSYSALKYVHTFLIANDKLAWLFQVECPGVASDDAVVCLYVSIIRTVAQTLGDTGLEDRKPDSDVQQGRKN